MGSKSATFYGLIADLSRRNQKKGNEIKTGLLQGICQHLAATICPGHAVFGNRQLDTLTKFVFEDVPRII